MQSGLKNWQSLKDNDYLGKPYPSILGQTLLDEPSNGWWSLEILGRNIVSVWQRLLFELLTKTRNITVNNVKNLSVMKPYIYIYDNEFFFFLRTVIRNGHLILN